MSKQEKIEQAKLRIADEALNLEGVFGDISEDLEDINWKPLFKAFKRYRSLTKDEGTPIGQDYSEADEQTWRKL